MYAKLNIDKTEVIEWFNTDVLPPHKAGYILPVEIQEMPVYNVATQYIIEGNTILSDKVIKTWVVIDKLAEELRALMVVTPAQIRLALIASGIDLSIIDTAFNAIENVAERQKAQVLWEYATIVERNNPFVIAIGGLLGKTPEEIDAIFQLASTLN